MTFLVYAVRKRSANSKSSRTYKSNFFPCCELGIRKKEVLWEKVNTQEKQVAIEEKVIGIVSEQLNVPIEEITKESRFVEDLKADSLDVVELVMEFEDEFGVTIPDEDYEKILTVGDAADYIEQKS